MALPPRSSGFALSVAFLSACSTASSTHSTSSAGGSTATATSATTTSSAAATTGTTTQASTSTGTGTGGGTPTGTPTFAVAGYDLRRLVSTDGMTWTHDVSDPPSQLDNIGDGIAFGRGIVAVVAHSGLVTSADGATWAKVGAPLPQAWPGLGGGKIVFTGSEFVIIASSDSYLSPDGATWTKHTSSAGATHWNGFAWGNGHFVAVGDSNSAGGDRKASEDGITWHDYSEGGAKYSALAFGNGVFVAVGEQGTVRTSTDGVTWQDHTDPTLGNIANLVFANGSFLFCGYPKCFTSADGVAWTPHDATSPPNGAMAYGLGLYVSVVWSSDIMTSPDGLHWTKVFSGAAGSPALNSVGFGTLGQ